MASGFSGNIRNQFRTANTLERLIIVNVAIYLPLAVTRAILELYKIPLETYFSPSEWLAVPSSFQSLIYKPWTVITYMFYHEEFFHILFNMLWLFWMGKIFTEYLGNKKLFSTYILGGICGAILYIAAYNFFPLFREAVHTSDARGASAGVLAITIATATLLPDYKIGILFLGPVALKYIAFASICIDLISMSGPNAGGHMAHLGGAIFGFIYIRQLKKGRDLAKGFNNVIDRLVTAFSGQRKMKVHYGRSRRDEDYVSDKRAMQERTDEILDKISKSGYGSLTKEEKEFLFNTSKEK